MSEATISTATTLDSVAAQVARFQARYQALWWDTPTAWPDALPDFGCGRRAARERAARERESQALLRTLFERLDRIPGQRERLAGWRKGVLAMAGELVRLSVGLEDPGLRAVLLGEFAQVAADFARDARQFDAHLSGADIFQAGRNAWVMNSLQLILGCPVQLTPAMFAYSLLYPYSDNYLDDPQVSRELKDIFLQRFARRLAGALPEPANAHERAIYALVSLIEGQYPRATYPQVYESLLAIHNAQVHSVRLHVAQALPNEVDVLGISLEKGGASVLADGYLVQGGLDESAADFMFGLGVLLQLVDDLQDVLEDRRDGVMTVYSQPAGRWKLDRMANRLLHFVSVVLDEAPCLASPHWLPLRELMRRRCIGMISAAVGRVPQLFSRQYVARLETCSPFSYAFLHKRRRKLMRRSAALLQLVERYADLELGT